MWAREAEAAPPDEASEVSVHLATRLASLRSWHASAMDLLPLIADLGDFEVNEGEAENKDH